MESGLERPISISRGLFRGLKSILGKLDEMMETPVSGRLSVASVEEPGAAGMASRDPLA